MERLIAAIRQVKDLNEKDALKVSSYLQRHKITKGQILFKEGDLCKHCYFILQGCMRLYQVDAQNSEKIKQFGVEGWWITDFSSFLKEEITEYYLQAIEDCEYLTLDHTNYQLLMQESPAFSNYFGKIYQEFFIYSQEMFFYTVQNDGINSYQYLLKKFPDLFQRVPLYMIASFLGLTPVFISKIRRRLVKEKRL